ncbi:MAG TPA: SDR family oxidoreductase [Thermoguttaceae bacterium]|nr:SDR family oxidoreductase [Thermoguttaceae bacterium]
MSYHLLTGATGLLGTYLLRDGLLAGRRMAVVVRRDKMESARQRVESVLARWERELGHALPRPPVLEGDLREPNMGFDSPTIDWVARHCVGLLHNAASLSFTANEKTGEPYRSNVDGVRNVLELCRTTGIREFHHVSTAYVCGLQHDRVLESDLDVGQQWANDYEQAKVQGEKLVRAADWIDPPTVYRPAIIIGDAATSYTTTFHGFYTPLKIGQALVDQFNPEVIDGTPLIAAMGLDGTERKNFVPVDWVSRVITHIHGRPEHHGQTYHLAPRRRVPVAMCQEVLERTLSEYVRQNPDRRPEAEDAAQLQATFIDQMGAYQAYWRDDPEFDLTNTHRAAPHLPCPDVDLPMLMRMADYAMKTNFGWPRLQPELPQFDVADHLHATLPIESSLNGNGTLKIGVQVNGPGGGQWTVAVDGRTPVAAEVGLTTNLNALVYLNSKTFEQCVRGQCTPQTAAERGLLTTESNGPSTEELLTVLSALASNP